MSTKLPIKNQEFYAPNRRVGIKITTYLKKGVMGDIYTLFTSEVD